MAVYNCQLLFEVGDNRQVFPFLRRGGYHVARAGGEQRSFSAPGRIRKPASLRRADDIRPY